MSRRLAPWVSLLALLVLACGGGKMRVKKGEPQTAREKMLAEEAANKKRGGDEDDVKPPGSKQWIGWRYQGERKDCFFVVGNKCFKTEKAACAAAKCKAPSKCETEGAGPAQLSCSKVAGGEPGSDDGKSDKKPSKKPSKKPKQKS